MKELFRFQQIRQSQELAEEQKASLGLSLYQNGVLSDFAKALQDPTAVNKTFDAVMTEFAEKIRAGAAMSRPADVHPLVRSVYDWLNFKARPLKVAEFRKLASTLIADDKFSLTNEWPRYADNMLIAIDNNGISASSAIDFQALIRACYLFALAKLGSNQHYVVPDTVTSDLVNEIANKPVLLPPGVVRSRGQRDDGRTNVISLPDPGQLQKVDGRLTCICICDPSCQKPSTQCIPISTYISDLFIIKEELARFEAGDIADIENILAGEKKERRHRTLLRTETTSETDTETNTTEERDHQVTEKNSLQDEIKNTVDSKVNVDAGVTANLKYGEAITITPHANVTANFAKSQSEDTARSYAKEIVDRSVSKIEEKVRTVQISKVLSEIEEKNLGGIDNTQAGADHRAGIFYWVNKVTHAQVYNYGRHMMFDLIIPEPAAIFKKLYQAKITNIDKSGPLKPTVTPQAITRGNYGNLLNQYAITSQDGMEPPDDTVAVQVAFSQNVPQPDGNKTMAFSSNEFKSPDIPAGYKAASMTFDVRCSTGHPLSTGDTKDQIAVSVHAGNIVLMAKSMSEYAVAVAGGALPLSNYDWFSTGNHPMNGEEGNITVAVAGFTTLALSLSGTISITCKLTDDAFAKWQCTIYNLIMGDYNQKLQAFNAANNKDDQLVQIKGRNPFLNREIERNELKRQIIAILMCNYFNGVGSMMDRVSPCGYPEIDFAKLEKDAPVIQFFEQVFEWEYMNYLFYHSMWARKCKWVELIDEDSGDPLFDKFLMAGASRVQVPVRPGMEDIFSWFLKTKQIWGASGVPPISGDNDYVSMIQELKEANDGDYSDRPGEIEATQGSDVLKLTDSTFYYDLVHDQVNQLNIDNDVDRELLVDFKVYRIVQVEQDNPADNSTWNITIDPPFAGTTAKDLKHAVGSVFVGAPWEIVVPTELVYLRNKTDLLPTYPLS